MKTKLRMLFTLFLTLILFTACGEDAEVTQFYKNIDDFCIKVSQIDTSINSIDATTDADAAVSELLSCLDELDMVFRTFSTLSFPEEFDYMKNTAKEASDYMTTAVESYHEAFKGTSYDEAAAEYAKENYNRAYKRIQIIISLLHGETPQDKDLISTEN